MKIVLSNKGQLCNRLWSYTYLIAHSLSMNERILIIDFIDYISLFQNLNRFPKVYFIKSKKLRTAILLGYKLFNITYPFTKRGLISLYCGWDYRSESAYIKINREKILELFKPKYDIIKKCHSFLSSLKDEFLIIGVHIRRNDYRDFFEGLYYYNNDIYIKYMKNCLDIFINKNGKKICFLLCSDEKLNLNNFKEFTCVQTPKKNAIEDLYGLSICDYILGPPSTFSMWASFYGNVPLYILSDLSKDLSIEDFKITTAVGRYDDVSLFEHITNE